VLGAVRFSFNDRRLFDEDEQRFVLALAAEAGEAIQRAQLLEDRARVAATLQQSLLPAALPTIPGLEVGAVYSAAGAGVGGDFYDVFPLADGHWGVAMGDVRGRGPQAAATTALVRYTIRTAALLGCAPGDVCGVVNTAMGQDDDDPERFCSAVYACVEVGDEGVTLTYANAGHPPPAVLRTGGVEFLPPTGGLLGILPTAFSERSVELPLHRWCERGPAGRRGARRRPTARAAHRVGRTARPGDRGSGHRRGARVLRSRSHRRRRGVRGVGSVTSGVRWS
jgi:serine phosphatase RsbU (regulator of sigma subunit)